MQCGQSVHLLNVKHVCASRNLQALGEGFFIRSPSGWYVRRHPWCWKETQSCTSVVATPSTLDGPRFESQQGQQSFLFSKKKRPDRLWGPPYVPWVQGKNGRGVKLTTQPHLLLRLRVSGEIPLLPLCAFIASTGKTLPLLLPKKRGGGKVWF